MSNRTLTDAVSSKPILGKGLVKWESFAMRYTRFALGAAFLSAVAGRFGIWGENTSPDSFKHFMEYTAKVNSFMPAFTIPFLAWAATIAETFLGITLILGIWLRFVALAAAGCWFCLAPPWRFRWASKRRSTIQCFLRPPERCC